MWSQLSVSLFLVCSTNSLQQTRKLKINLTSFFISHCVSNYSANSPSFAFKLYSEHDHFHHHLLTIDFHSFHVPPTVIHHWIARAIFLNFKISPFPSNPKPRFLGWPPRHIRSGLQWPLISPPCWLHLDRSTHSQWSPCGSSCILCTFLPECHLPRYSHGKQPHPLQVLVDVQFIFSVGPVLGTLFKIQPIPLFPWPALRSHFILLCLFTFIQHLSPSTSRLKVTYFFYCFLYFAIFLSVAEM